MSSMLSAMQREYVHLLCLFMLREDPPCASLFTDIFCLVALDFQTLCPLSSPNFWDKELGNNKLLSNWYGIDQKEPGQAPY